MTLIPESLQLMMIRILTPLVRILLRNGISYGTFADMAKKVYVDVGFEEAERRGQKTTISNVSILTGINRKEVKRLMDTDTLEAAGSLKKANRIVRVLMAWQSEREFTDDEHRPLELPLDGADVSFTSLVRRFSGDMPVVAMLNALKDSGYIQLMDGDRVRLIKRSLTPDADPEEKLVILGTDTAELIETIDHNIQIKDPKDAWFQGKAWNVDISCGALPGLKKEIDQKALKLLQEVDTEFNRNKTDDQSDTCQVAVGIYYHMKKSDSAEDPVQ